MITKDAVLVRSGDLVAAPVGAELVMMSITHGSYFGFDAVGAWMWGRLEHPTSVATLCAELQMEYEVSPQQCQADVLAFLEHLYAKGIIEIVG